MASSYVNDLRLNEMATGDASGTWGDTTNTNLELIAEAFSYGTEAITTNADTHTTTIADGATDPGRSMYLKYTGTLDSACTITIGPNTVSKVWIIENGTSGSQDIILSQGSGANITIPAGDTKVVYSDGAGAGAAFFDAFASLSVVDLTATGIVTAAGTSVFTNLDISGDVDVDGTLETDNLTVGGAQGTDGQLLTSTGSGVAWEDAPAGGPTFKTFGTGSIMVGDDATGTIDAADNNTGLGVDVFAALTSGDSNVAVGFAALTANTTGDYNVSIGEDALAANVTAHRATAVGYQALKTSNVSGNSNSGNTAVGFQAGTAMTTGIANTLVGALAGDAITTGSYNTAVGYDALTANTTGGENTAFGFTALQNNTTASNNTGLGRAALEANTEGADNTGVGHAVSGSNTTGSRNTASGYRALYSNSTGNNAVAVGYQAGYSQTASTTVAVGASAAYDLTTSDDSVFVGSLCGENVTTGYAAVMMGDRAGQLSTTGAYNVFLGYKAGDNVTTGSGNIVIGSADTSSSTSSNECTIPVTTFRLQTSSITNYSDARDKSNVQDSPYGLEFLEKVKLRKWLWDCREEFKKDNQLDGKERIGFVAQELLEAMDEGDNEILDLVYESNPDRLEVRYGNLLPIALKAIQELSAKVKELEDKLDD
jgi:trimeric autotransporter adhesin